MNLRERFKKVLSFEKVDRLPVIEWASWWNETVDRWRKEGLPDSAKTGSEIMEYLGLDAHNQFWIWPAKPTCPWPSVHGEGLLKDVTPDGYRELRKHLFPEDVVRHLREDIVESVNKQQAGDTVIWLTLEGFFWFPRRIFGIEGHLYAFYDEPELMHMINEDLLSFHMRVLDEFLSLCTPDFMTFAEDMSYNKGPMISEPLFNEFVAPYYRQIMKKLGNIPVIIDTDGDITGLIPWFMNLGIKGFLPLERQAGVDIAALRESYPDLLIIGGFDKTVMHLGEAAIRKEFERILPVMKQGGYIPSVDHQTPPAVSLEDYRLYVKLLKEYCEL